MNDSIIYRPFFSGDNVSVIIIFLITGFFITGITIFIHFFNRGRMTDVQVRADADIRVAEIEAAADIKCAELESMATIQKAQLESGAVDSSLQTAS